jgi:hypothetical protein
VYLHVVGWVGGWVGGYSVSVLVAVYTLYMYRYNLTAVCTVCLLASAHTHKTYAPICASVY